MTGWGILATGRIARTVAADLALVPGAELVAVGSRTAAGAARFVADFPATAYSSYAELVADPRVEVVYVASPHSHHLEHAGMALEAGNHVLCEKPLTLTAADSEQLIATAARCDRFLMEAMWTACHPVVRALARRLADGEFGTPRHLHAELGFRVGEDASPRMLGADLGASALLDMGIYPLTFAHLMLGEAVSLTAQADVDPAGVDLSLAAAGRYPGGALATLVCSMTSWSSRAAAIATDRGRIDVPTFHHPTHATFTAYDDRGTNDTTRTAEPIRIEGDEPVIGNGYAHEILEVERCLAAGLRESPLVPHAQTLTIARQMDRLRAQVAAG